MQKTHPARSQAAQTAFHLGLILILVFPGILQTAVAQPRNLDIIVQRDTLVPPTMAEIELVWGGGAGPNWTWTIEVDGIEDHILEGTTQASQCDVPGALFNCRSAPFMVPFNFAEILTIRAAVLDSEDELASAVRRVRMGTNESFWIDSVTPARITPGANGTFNCDSDDADDPPWITLSGDDRSFPLIDVFRDARISLPDSLVTWDITPDPENPAAEILYIIDRINQSDEFDGLAFPLQYGSTQADTRVLPAPPTAIAPLQPGRLYQIRLTGEPFPCEFSSGSPQISFMLNPPAPGDPVIARGPANDADVDVSDPEFLEFLEFIAAGGSFHVDPGQQAIAGCMDEQLGLQVLSVLTAGTELGKAFPIKTGAASVFLLLTDPENMDRLKTFCADNLMAQTAISGGEPPAVQAAATTDFDLEIVSGSSRITLAEPTLLTEVRTAHASVIVSDATLEIAQTEDGRRSAIGSPDTEIVVTPNNPALPETSVPPGFFVILSDTSISTPNEFAMFVDGFE